MMVTRHKKQLIFREFTDKSVVQEALRTGPIGCPEISVRTSVSCVKSPKSGDLNDVSVET